MPNKPTPRILALQKQLYNQYKANKNEWVKKYGSEAEAVMTGAAFKNAQRMADKKDLQRVKEAVKTALTKKPKTNPEDVISMDVPLLIRMLEYAREDAKTDMDLHKVTENLIELSKNGRVLNMKDYNNIVSLNSKA